MRNRRDENQFKDRRAYAMCKRKKKFKSSEAGRIAGKLRQRKYACPICGGWHLTKQRGFNDRY